MTGLLLTAAMAVTVEALVEYSKTLVAALDGGGWKPAVIRLAAAALGVLLCFAAGADLYGTLGVKFSCGWIGTVLTGIFASRGANYVSDLVAKLKKSPNQ